MLKKAIPLIENKLVAVLLLALFVSWGVVHAPFKWDTGVLPTAPVAVDAIPDIGENQQIVFTPWDGRSSRCRGSNYLPPNHYAARSIPGVKTIRSSSMFGFQYSMSFLKKK